MSLLQALKLLGIVVSLVSGVVGTLYDSKTDLPGGGKTTNLVGRILVALIVAGSLLSAVAQIVEDKDKDDQHSRDLMVLNHLVAMGSPIAPFQWVIFASVPADGLPKSNFGTEETRCDKLPGDLAANAAKQTVKITILDSAKHLTEPFSPQDPGDASWFDETPKLDDEATPDQCKIYRTADGKAVLAMQGTVRNPRLSAYARSPLDFENEKLQVRMPVGIPLEIDLLFPGAYEKVFIGLNRNDKVFEAKVPSERLRQVFKLEPTPN